MQPEEYDLTALFPGIAAQMRGALSNLRLATDLLVPAEARERDPQLDRRAAVLEQSYYQLLRLVGNLSAAAQLNSDRPLPLQNRDLVALVGHVCACSAGLAELLEIDLRFLCAMDSCVCAVCADQIEQLLYHLLSNALKFTPAGGSVTVELKRSAKHILLSVSDTGRGMDDQQLSMLFERYRHADVLSPAPHGFGLGLALCHSIAQRHGGTLVAQSTPQQGSRFTLSLPLRQTESSVSDVPYDYAGGYNRTLLCLADALPSRAFLHHSID